MKSYIQTPIATYEDGKATFKGPKAMFEDEKATFKGQKATFIDEKAMFEHSIYNKTHIATSRNHFEQ